MIMAKLRKSQPQRLELRGEIRLVIGLEAAQIEPECAVGDAADHRPRQRPQRFLESVETGALSLDGTHSEPIARQLLERLRAAADLTEEWSFGYLVALTERAFERCPQTACLGLELRDRSSQQPQRRQTLRQMLRVSIERQHRIESRERQLTDPQRPLERIATESLDQVGAAHQ